MTGMHWAFVIIGAFFALLGLGNLVNRVRTFAGGRVVDGVVVGKKEGSHISGSGSNHKITVMFHPIVEFEHEGRKYRTASSLGEKTPPSVGTRLRIRYLPSDPQGTAAVDSFLAFWGFPVGALVLGSVIAFFAAHQGGLIP